MRVFKMSNYRFAFLLVRTVVLLAIASWSMTAFRDSLIFDFGLSINPFIQLIFGLGILILVVKLSGKPLFDELIKGKKD